MVGRFVSATRVHGRFVTVPIRLDLYSPLASESFGSILQEQIASCFEVGGGSVVLLIRALRVGRYNPT